MRHIYYELNEIPVPDFGRPDGDRVYAWASMGGGEKKKIYIGWYAKKNVSVPTFYPSENFRLYYPVEWEKNYGSRLLPQHYVEIGIYTVMLALGHRTGIYPILHSSFGPMYGNAVMDYAMYSIKERRNAAYLFKPADKRYCRKQRNRSFSGTDSYCTGLSAMRRISVAQGIVA